MLDQYLGWIIVTLSTITLAFAIWSHVHQSTEAELNFSATSAAMGYNAAETHARLQSVERHCEIAAQRFDRSHPSHADYQPCTATRHVGRTVHMRRLEDHAAASYELPFNVLDNGLVSVPYFGD